MRRAAVCVCCLVLLSGPASVAGEVVVPGTAQPQTWPAAERQRGREGETERVGGKADVDYLLN